MKKADVINLIKTHYNDDDLAFKRISYRIADEFASEGDMEIANTIYGLVSDAYNFSTQDATTKLGFLELVKETNEQLFFPEPIMMDIVGVFNAINRGFKINKFLFYGAPGTGKTEAVRLISKKLKKSLWRVSIRDLIDSKLGETSKNIHNLFSDISSYPKKNKMIVLFDEIDSLALNRSDSRDLREMGRATTELFIGLDGLDPNVILIATTNLYSDFDSALLRRFQKHIDFSRYSKNDLIELGCLFYDEIIDKTTEIDDDKRLVKKIMSSYHLPYPGDLKNIIVSAIAFSDPNNRFDYFSRLILSLDEYSNPLDMSHLKEKGFSLREIAKITSKSKSVVGRRLSNA